MWHHSDGLKLWPIREKTNIGISDWQDIWPIRQQDRKGSWEIWGYDWLLRYFTNGKRVNKGSLGSRWTDFIREREEKRREDSERTGCRWKKRHEVMKKPKGWKTKWVKKYKVKMTRSNGHFREDWRRPVEDGCQQCLTSKESHPLYRITLNHDALTRVKNVVLSFYNFITANHCFNCVCVSSRCKLSYASKKKAPCTELVKH